MAEFTRRDTFRIGAGTLGTAAFVGNTTPARAGIPIVDVAPPAQPIEPGATLRVIRPTKFVDPDEIVWNENTARFTKETGVAVRTDFLGWEDIRPQVAVAARTGAGPDVVVGWANDPHIYADKIIDMTALATYLGKKYGGWGPLPQKYGHPCGFTLGNAVGDGNGTANWLLWAHGGYAVDEHGKVAINRKETIEALKYSAELYKTMIPGTLSWLDPSNNKAFIAEEISMTFNGVSVYFVLKNDPKTAAIAADTFHSRVPGSFHGRAPESATTLNAMVFKHTKYPNAAKEYLRYMMEAPQYDAWLTKCMGYWAHPLLAFDQSDCWKVDPKILPYRDAQKLTFWEGYQGPITAATGQLSSEYVLVQMFAAAASGQATPEEAVQEAERRMQRIYRKA